MKRANPAEFPEKFKRHGVEPSLSYYVVRDNHECAACALGIEAVDAVGLERVLETPKRLEISIRTIGQLAELAGFSFDYANGLDCGWQGRPHQEDNGDEYDQGFGDGRAAYEACADAGLVHRLAP